MGFMLFKNGNDIEVYHTDIGYDELFGNLRIYNNSLALKLDEDIVMSADGAIAIANFLAEWKDNPTVLEILGD